jgi:branched-chain amino acid transport system substrate-binding protein
MPTLPTTPAEPVLPIALLMPASGELATFGRMMGNGAIMAFDEWNERGLLGYRLEWTIYNTDCTFDTAQEAAQQAIDDGHHFVIGPLCSEAAIAAAAVADSANALMISPTAMHPLVTVDSQGRTRPPVFRVSYTPALQGQAAAYFALNALKASNVALLTNSSDDYATKLTDTFARDFSAAGGQIVYQGTYPPGNTDFTDALMAIHQSGAELIYLPAMPSIANQVARQLNELGLSNASGTAETNLTLLGSDGLESNELDLVATAGTYFAVHFTSEDNRPSVQGWAEAYKSTYAIEPDTLAALGYDAANILTSAIQQAGTFETTAVARTLEQNTFSGVTGEISFDHYHNPIKPVPFVQVQDERLIFVTSVSPPATR